MSNKKKREKKFIEMPQYRGGNTAMRKFINENLRYPEEALKNQISGTVFLSYVVASDGTVEDVQVMKGLGYGCDEEAVRVISLLEYEPAHNRGLRVRSNMRTRINFRLPAAPAPVISYSVVKEQPKAPPKEKPAPKVNYGYTIVVGSGKQE